MRANLSSLGRARSWMGGFTYTELESMQEQYRNVRSKVISEDPGLAICNGLTQMLWKIFDVPMFQKEYVPLFILMTHGPKVLDVHRKADEYY